MKQEFIRIYTKYKKQILPTALILLSLFIVFKVIVPQLSSISDTNSVISTKKLELETLNNSIKVLQTSSDDAVSADLALSVDALPTTKDVSRIFGALTTATKASNTELSEFTLKIGGVLGKDISTGDVSAIGVPQIKVVTRITATDSMGLVRFAKEVSHTLPLSEIKKIDTVGNEGTFEINFYYKPLDLNIISKNDKVSPLTPADRTLLNQLNGFGR